MGTFSLQAWAQRVERACYRLDRSTPDWLEQIALALRPVLDIDGLGVAGGFYECPDPCSLTPKLILGYGMQPELETLLLRGISTLSPSYVAATFSSSGMGPGSYFQDWTSIGPVRDGSLESFGLADTCAIRAADLGGSGIWFVSFRKQTFQLTGAEWRAFAQVRRHIALAHRLRRRLAGKPLAVEHADVALDHGGRVLHVQAPAPSCLLQHLSAAAAALDEQHGPNALAEANAQDTQWTAVEHVEADGRRYVLAFRNTPGSAGIELLSTREREVLSRVVNGRAAKEIAYDLGLAHSTVRVLLARAATKLGARSRAELLEKAVCFAQHTDNGAATTRS